MNKVELKKYCENKKKELQVIYDSVPKMICENNCRDCCGMTRWFPVEAINIIDFLKAYDMKEKEAKSFLDYCPYLDKESKCTIYPVRPIICRLFGSTDHTKIKRGIKVSMICPKDCKPKKYLTSQQSISMMNKIATMIPDNIMDQIAKERGWFD